MRPDTGSVARDEHPAGTRAGVRWKLAAAAVVVAAAGAVVAVAALHGGRPDVAPPNVLLLVMDTTRADRCSVTGAPRPTTPALERLAAEGVRYVDAWSPAGWTAPAHASMFTGLRPPRHGVDIDRRVFLDPAIPTLAQRLEAAGWSTGCFTNNGWIAPHTGLARGFARYEPLHLREERPYPWCVPTHAMALDWAIAERDAGRRFFLFVNDTEPHLPYSPPEAFAAQFLPADATADEIAAARSFGLQQVMNSNVLGRMPSPRQLEILRALYDGEIAALDASIGDLVEGFRAAGLLDDTLVIVCADHGENFGDHGWMEHRFSLHRSIRRVPLVVRLPRLFDGGRTVTDVVRLEDIFPTVLDVCGIPAPPGLDSASLLDDTSGRVSRGTWGRSATLLTTVRRYFPNADLSKFDVSIEAVFDGRRHYIRTSDGREELYDVAADPDETRDLAPSGSADLARMRELLTGK